MRYRAIGFDYSWVIAGIPGSEFNRQVIRLLNVDLETFNRTYFRNNHLINHGALSMEEFWGKVLTEMNKLDKLEKLLEFIRSIDQHKINNEVLSFAKHLRTLGYKIGILSNHSLGGLERMRDAGLMEVFDIVTVSAEIGFSKPDPMAFRIFSERLGISPNELIFVDDTIRSLESSKDVGFYPVLFEWLIEVKAELKKIKVL